MLIPDLKKVLEHYSSKDKDKIIVELYKRIPKSKREDYDIDEFILNINTPITKEVKVVTIDNVIDETREFINNAYSDLYVSPNKIISKKDRSKWRFVAKRLFKDLKSFKPDTEDGEAATEYLIDLYELLSSGTHTLYFSSWNTFGALGTPQSEYYDMLIKRLFAKGVTKEALEQVIDLLDVDYDPNEYHVNLYVVLKNNLESNDVKEIAAEILKQKYIEGKEDLKILEKQGNSTYYKRQLLNGYIEIALDLFVSMDRVDEAIDYFHKNYIEKDKEIEMYVLLNYLDKNELYTKWIEEYENNKNIDYRNNLKKRYKELKSEKVNK